MQQISRYGAYGVIVENSKLLLTQKRSGPYKGLWDLPGGGIEFKETPEETLRRELLEEAAIFVNQIELMQITTSFGEYIRNGNPYHFHHIGIIYCIKSFSVRPELTPEEEDRWVALDKIDLKELTPFAKQVYKNIGELSP